MKRSLYIILPFISIVSLFVGCKKRDTAVEANDTNVEVKKDYLGIKVCIDKGNPYTDPPNMNLGSQLTMLNETNWETGQTLRVRFLDNGTEFVRRQVEFFARLWERHTNIRFRFVVSGDAEIRIGFVQDGTSWSRIGRESENFPQNQSTMNFGWFNNQTTEEEFRRTTLHEFGHALGMVHEHQHPQNQIQWDRVAVLNFYLNLGWTAQQVQTNIFNCYSVDRTQFSRYDALSIMHYPIPNELTLNDYEVGWNIDLSAIDICYIRRLYPFPGDRFYFGVGYGVHGGNGWYIGDYNKDGKHDIMRYLNSNGGAEVCLSNTNSFGNIKQWSGSGIRGGKGWYVGDFNGDGKDDIMRYLNSNGGAEVCLSNGNSFGSPTQWSGSGIRGGEGWYIGDFNGDGKDDIMRFVNGNGGAEVCLSTGHSFGSPIPWSVSGVKGGRGWYVGDFNGDGKDDIMRYLNSNGGAEVCLSTGHSFGIPKQWSGYGVKGGQGWYIGDFNGDGKDDIMRYLNSNGGAEVCLSNGTSFGVAKKWSGLGIRGGDGWYVGDYNADGKSDIFRYINQYGGAEVLLSTGNRFASTVISCD